MAVFENHMKNGLEELPATPKSYTDQSTQVALKSKRSSKLTPKLALQLAAPHTWSAAIMPVLIAVCLSIASTGQFHVLMAIVLLAICVLMQSSVNAFNDYFDFINGEDSADDDVEASDAVLIYNDVRPRSVLALAIGLLVAAFALGIYIVIASGWIPFVIGVVGAAVIVAYSAGPASISHLPIGELISGVVMGGLIPIACYISLTGSFDPRVIACAIPTIVGVGMIMLTNNTCDIEKDIESGRKTLPVIIGRKASRTLYHILLAVWIISIVALAAIYFSEGLPILVFMVLASIPVLRSLATSPLAPGARIGTMSQIGAANVVLGAFYAAAILVDGISMVVI